MKIPKNARPELEKAIMRIRTEINFLLARGYSNDVIAHVIVKRYGREYLDEIKYYLQPWLN